MVLSSSESVAVIDAFDGREILKKTNEDISVLTEEEKSLSANLPQAQSTGISSMGASFSPNGQFVFVGTEDGRLITLDTSGNRCHTFPMIHSGDVCASFNPRYMMMVSACQNICFWVPSMP